MPEREGTGSEPRRVMRRSRSIYECGCVLVGDEGPRDEANRWKNTHPLLCPVHRAIWADKRPLDREIGRIADTLDGDLHLHHADGPCEPINPVDLVGHVLNQAGLVVEPGHDEQTERLNTGEAGDIADEFMAAQQAWQPDPRTVAAVVEALREADHAPGGNPGFMHMSRAADFIEERFKPSAPGGDTGNR